MSRAALVVLTLLSATVAGCQTSEPAAVETPLPDGIVMHVDQSRVERKGRQVFVRIENSTPDTLTVERFELTSPRLADVRWSGHEVIGSTYEGDLEFDLPSGRCGTAVDAKVTLRYRLGDGSLRRSTGPADDPYDAIALLADRDCAETTLTAAAVVTVGSPTITGRGRESVLRLPVRFTPTGRSTGVRFAGFQSTVLFRQTIDSPADVDVPLDAGDPATTQVLTVVPARCDPHALAEDKVGTLFGVRVRGAGLDDDAEYYLPLTPAQRSAFFAFFSTHCGLG